MPLPPPKVASRVGWGGLRRVGSLGRWVVKEGGEARAPLVAVKL